MLKGIARRVLQSDWDAVSEIESRWRQDGVSPMSRHTFNQWLGTNPEGFIIAEDESGLPCGHVYCESLQFDPEGIGEPNWDSLFTRPYEETHHNLEGNSCLILNIVASPGNSAGILLVNAIIALAKDQGQEWLIAIPRMPGLADYRHACEEEVKGSLPDVEIIAAKYAVGSMLQVNAPVNHRILERTRRVNLPEPRKPDPVVAKFAGRRAGMTLYEIIKSGYSDPVSLDLAAFCLRRLI